MEKENLSPDLITPLLKERRLELQKALDLKLKLQKTAPQGHLRIAQTGGRNTPQFYHITDSKDFKGQYIPKTQAPLRKRLAQKDYDAKVIKLLIKQLHALDTLTKTTDGKIEELYAKISRVRKSLVTPVTLTDSQYAEDWQNITWQGLPFADNTAEHFTIRNERVRSKSEVLIADNLAHHKVPYRYEFPLQLHRPTGGNITIYPDFTCLNVRTRQEFIWEHFGMMDDAAYLENAIQKLKLYSENKIIPGKNLIITMETQATPISTKQIEKQIEAFLI